MNDSLVRNHRLIVSKRSLRLFYFASFWTAVVFVRLLFARHPFSFDYDAYIFIIKSFSELAFSEIFGTNLIFPYTVSKEIVPIEFGFSLLVKLVSGLGFDPEITYALIASASVGLRVHTMRSLRVPVLWIIWTNIIAITLLEANALRLGVAASTLLFGLRQLHWSRKLTGFFAMAIALTFHLQVIFFVAPFVTFYFLSGWIRKSTLRLVFTLVGLSITMVYFVQLLPMLENEKLQEYVARGTSGSSGITVTSLLAILLLGSVVVALRKGWAHEAEPQFFLAILTACVPSVFLLVFLTDVAVVGDRAWQLAFLVISTFFFTNWAFSGSKRIPLYMLVVLSVVMQTNVLVRYPLSNFFSPPFPMIDYSKR